jgi:tetratricopeptide (TPR) repeat protein
MLRSFSVLLLSLYFLRAAVSQTPSSKPNNSDYSQEAVVIEMLSEKEKFENDGTSFKEGALRVRIQSEAAVQQYGLLSFSYASGTGTFDIEYVRVHKPDGSVVETPSDSIQDMPAQITRQAPFYSDLHEKHVAVKGLGVGDVLEYKVHEQTTKPLAPGQFWTAHTFTDQAIVLNQQLEISVPSGRAIKFKSPDHQPVITEAGGYRTYTWHSDNLHRKDDSNNKRDATEQAWKQARGRLKQSDVLLSSFQTWDEVARWYGSLQEERVKPTSEVTAKAAELTKGATNDEAKIHALYDYVSTQFRYIGVAFGIGRYQPHGASEVLENQYGDCKDKHTLLASLLASVGISAYPALINTTMEVDADVPSPGQFDHVITVVPNGHGLIWLDTTAEVAPFALLLSPLRDKHALVIWKDKPAALLSTPVDPPFDSVQTFNIDAKLSDAGTLEGSAGFSARGDLEYLLRAAFRVVPLPQWKELGQRISFGAGFGGEVSEVTASSPEKTDQPFHFSYKYTRKEFGDWPNHRILSPEPIINLLAPGDDEQLPLGPSYLGPLLDIHFHSQIELPGSYVPSLPAPIHLVRDFAQFDATYAFKDGKLSGDRHLKTLMREVPASERENYISFIKAVQDEYGAYIPLLSGVSSAPSVSGGWTPMPFLMRVLGSLPNSSNSEAAQLETDARQELATNDLEGAASSLRRAVAADPKFTRAWVLLGSLLITQKQLKSWFSESLQFAHKQKDDAIDAFHNAMALDPSNAAIPKLLGMGLMSKLQFDDAVLVWQDFIKSYPNDIDGPTNLGSCLDALKRYSDEATAYEAAEKIGGDRAHLEAMIGMAYMHAGNQDKATAVLTKLAEANPKSLDLNDVAYEMAEEDFQLPLAVDYAKKAVLNAEQESQKITLGELKPEDLKQIFTLAAYWDTLGWVYERMSNMELAEAYLKAAWRVSQSGAMAAHLCDLYRRTSQTAAGIQMCQAALYTLTLSPNISLDAYQKARNAAQENRDYFIHGASSLKGTVDTSNMLLRERTFKLPRFLPGNDSAEFFVLLVADAKSKNFRVEDAKFITGSEKMRLEAKQLKAVDFKVPAPDDIPTHIVRRGFLGCYQYTGCSFVLLDAASVHSIN